MTPWQSHPTFRGLLATGASEPHALDLAADWLMAEANLVPSDLPAVLRWYAGEPPSWDTGEDGVRAGVLWRWLRLMEPTATAPFSPTVEAWGVGGPRWKFVEVANDGGIVQRHPLYIKRHVLQAFPDVSAEVTFRGRVRIDPLEIIDLNGPHVLLTVHQKGGAERQFHCDPHQPFGWWGSDTVCLRLPAPQWIGEEDVRRAATMDVLRTTPQLYRRSSEIMALAAEPIDVGDFVARGPDNLFRVVQSHEEAEGRALESVQGGQLRVLLSRDVLDPRPASPPAPPA